MAGYNFPWGAAAAPQIGSPIPGPRGPIYPQMSGGMPYRPNPVGEGLDALGRALQGFGQMKQGQREAAKSDFQNWLQAYSAGLNPSMDKGLKLAKKAGFSKFFDFERSVPQPSPETSLAMPSPGGGQGPVSYPGANGPQQTNLPIPMQSAPGAGRFQMPAGPVQMPGGGGQVNMPIPAQGGTQLPAPPLPQGPAGMPMPARGPSFLDRLKGVTGLGLPYVNPNSQGAAAVRQLADTFRNQYQAGQAMQRGQMQTALADMAVKQRTLGLTLAAMGVGPNGPLDDATSFKARTLLLQGQTHQKFEADDLGMIEQTARRAGASDEQIGDFTRTWVREKTGANKYLDTVNNLAKVLMDNGVASGKAWTGAFQIAEGRGVPELPQFKPETLKNYIEGASKLRQMYPTAPPSVWQAVDPLIWTGQGNEAMRILGRGPTGESLEEGRKTRAEGRAVYGQQLEAGRLAVSQGELGLGRERFKYQKEQDRLWTPFKQSIEVIDRIRKVASDEGRKSLTDDERRVVWGQVANLMPGMFRVREDPGLLWGSIPRITPMPGANPEQGALPEEPSKFDTWFLESFAPALEAAVGTTTKSYRTPSGKKVELPLMEAPMW